MTTKLTNLMALIILSFFVTGCFKEKNLSFKIADAENQFFTKSGRLFITGGKNIFEIRKDSSNKLIKSEPLFGGKCYATGIIQHRNFLYATCTSMKKPTIKELIKGKKCRIKGKNLLNCLKHKFSRSYLLAAELNENPEFEIISPIDQITFPNGLTVDKSGNIYSADSISKEIFKIKISSYDPYQIESIKSWYNKNLTFPNGLKIRNNSLFVTDFNKLKKITITNEGRPGALKVIYKSKDLLDDFSFYKKSILVTKFSKGIITLIKENGKNFNSPRFKMHPSSILQGKRPLFKENQFIVTDKGLPYDFRSDLGNRIKIITIDHILIDKT